MLLRLFLLLPLFFSFSSIAAQRLSIKEDGEVTAYISAIGLNRIAVEGDRVVTVKGLAGQFQLDKDQYLGQIYIQPTQADLSNPIYLFVSTEKGKTYTLNLLTHDRASENVILVPIDFVQHEKRGQSSDYEEQLVDLVKAMHTHLALEGFIVKDVSRERSDLLGAPVTLVRSLEGEKLKGEIYQVINKSNKNTLITEKDFFQKGVRAISIVHKELTPHSKTFVYVVKDYVN